MHRRILILVACAFVTACSSTPKKSAPALTEAPIKGLDTQEKDTIVKEILQTDAAFSLSDEELDEFIEEQDIDVGPRTDNESPTALLAHEIARRSLAKRKAHTVSDIPVELNKKVGKWIRYFTEKDRARLQRFLTNGAPYRKMIERTLEKHRVPQDLIHVAMIESGFQNHARSRAAAVGMWQFGRATGKSYGLRSNYYVDERRDPIRATEAAARHLRDLHRRFGSWYLALAAYNSGTGRVRGAIRRGKTRDFWELIRKRVLPRETRNYVPKFLASVIISHNLAKFGFKEVHSAPYPALQTVKVPARVRLRDISRKSGIPLAELKKYNPHIRRGIVPRIRGSKYPIYVKPHRVARLKKATPMLASLRVPMGNPYRGKAGKGQYRVRRGDNLGKIARRFGTRVSTLKRWNGLSSSRIYAGQVLKVKKGKRVAKRGGSKKYRVRRGDSLSTIARRFGLSIARLKRMNGLRRNLIRVGDVLTIASR